MTGLAVLCLLLPGCESVLDPMPNGHYTDENLSEYPTKLRGFVDKAYSLANVETYQSNEYIYLDCATEDGVLTSPGAALRKRRSSRASQSLAYLRKVENAAERAMTSPATPSRKPSLRK